MRSNLISIFLSMLALVLLAASPQVPTLLEIQTSLNPATTDEDERLEYWEPLKGRTVSWTGTFHKARGGFRDTYKVYIKVDTPDRWSYNVILTVEDPHVEKLKKGQEISFIGKLRSYKWSKPHPVTMDDGKVLRLRQFVVYVDNGKLLSMKGK